MFLQGGQRIAWPLPHAIRPLLERISSPGYSLLQTCLRRRAIP